MVTAKVLTYLFVLSITPGPNNITCLYLGASKGLKGVFRFLTASMLFLLIKAVLCGLLNIALADIIPQAVKWLKWLGAAYMLYLAVHMALSGWREEAETKGAEGTFLSGVLLQVLNAKSWIGSLSLFAVYVIPVDPSVGAVVLAAAVFTVTALLCSLVWASFGSMLRSFISRYRKPFGIIMGLSLVWCALTAVL